MNTTYPYISAQDRQVNWEFSVTVKPGTKIFLQGISKAKLAKLKKKSAERAYEDRLQALALGFGASTKAEYARRFYQEVFGKDAIFKSRSA